MKAAVYYKHGKPDVLEVSDKVPVPMVGTNDILIRVHAASLNPVDWKFIDGMFSILEPILGIKFPQIPGFDVAGEVVGVGSTCTRFVLGDRVFSMQHFLPRGTIAEYVSVDESRVAIMPINWTFEEAASIPLVGITNYLSIVETARFQSGQRILILGGAGGTGTNAIQLAHALGAREIITTASAANAELMTRLGATRIINYKNQDWRTELKGANLDVVYDCVGGAEAYEGSAQVLKSGGGKFVTIVGDGQPHINVTTFLAKAWRVVSRAALGAIGAAPEYHDVMATGTGAQMEAIRALAAAGALRPVIDKVYLLDEVRQAFTHLRKGHSRGKVIIKIIA